MRSLRPKNDERSRGRGSGRASHRAGASASHARARSRKNLGRPPPRLRGLEDEDIREIVEELRSHIMDKAATAGEASGEITSAGVDTAFAALGSPEELASQYLTDNLLARAEVSRSPVQILRSLFRWASLSVAGLCVLLGCIAGYFFGAVFVLVALLKPLHPHTAGLWTFP